MPVDAARTNFGARRSRNRYVKEEIVEVAQNSPQEHVQNYTVEHAVDVPVRVIMKIRAEKCLEMFTEIAELNDDHKKLYEQFVKCMKLGILENSVDDFEIVELLRSNTSKLEDEKINWKEYVDRMKDELILNWLNFVKGVVDSEDIPLNISGEIVRQNKILRVIKKKFVKRCLEMIAESVDRKDDCEKCYEQFGPCWKLGIREDSIIRAKIAGLLRFNASMSGDEQVSMKEYVGRMTEEQNDVYYITGESIAMVSSSSFLENLRKKGLEVLYMVDPVSEYAVQQLKEVDGKKLKFTTKEGLDFGDEDEKKSFEELKIKFESLRKLMKEILGDKVEKVIVNDRIVNSSCVLTMSEHGLSAKMEHIIKAQALRDNSMYLASGSMQQLHTAGQTVKEEREGRNEGGESERKQKVKERKS